MACRLIQALALLLCLSWSATTLAAIEVREFDSALQKQRYDSLNGSLRCPKCENQAIGDSESPIAGDMRERVYQLLQDGRSDIEIQNYMTERFGDFVLYNPRLTGRTWLLWGLPAGLVLLGAIVIGFIVRVRRRASNHALSAAERERLDALVNRERTQ